MRRIELTWSDGQWGGDIAEMIVEEIAHALQHPVLVKHPWVEPDSIRVIREGDPIYPDGEIRLPAYDWAEGGSR